MEKLLHERLKGIRFPYELDQCMGTCGEHEFEDTINRIIDEIERYYIPRPRDNKGIPFVEGETIYSIDPDTEYSAEVVKVNASILYVYWEDGEYNWVDACDMQHEKPQPKILDADGVEIKVGDTVWSTNGFQGSAEVTEIKDGVHDVHLYHEDHAQFYYCSKQLTHKEPDSLERIKEDSELEMIDYFRKYPDETRDKTKMEHLLQRAIALIERGA